LLFVRLLSLRVQSRTSLSGSHSLLAHRPALFGLFRDPFAGALRCRQLHRVVRVISLSASRRSSSRLSLARSLRPVVTPSKDHRDSWWALRCAARCSGKFVGSGLTCMHCCSIAPLRRCGWSSLSHLVPSRRVSLLGRLVLIVGGVGRSRFSGGLIGDLLAFPLFASRADVNERCKLSTRNELGTRRF
jgi:hypothetical protein